MPEAAKQESENDFNIEGWAEALGIDKGPPPKIIISTGKEVQVNKATAAQLYLILDLLRVMAIHLKVESFDNLEEMVKSIENPIDFLGMLSGSMDRMLALVVELCDIGEETVNKGLDLDDLLLIVWAEWKVNENFFMTRLLPMIQRLGTGSELSGLVGLQATEESSATES